MLILYLLFASYWGIKACKKITEPDDPAVVYGIVFFMTLCGAWIIPLKFILKVLGAIVKSFMTVFKR